MRKATYDPAFWLTSALWIFLAIRIFAFLMGVDL